MIRINGWHPDGYRDCQQHDKPLEIEDQEMFEIN